MGNRLHVLCDYSLLVFLTEGGSTITILKDQLGAIRESLLMLMPHKLLSQFDSALNAEPS